jgi:alpha-D-xyloside xylohydrolase
MDYPSDPQVRDIDDEYMAGDNILVAPVTAGNNKRKVYLPEGVWYCFWTNRKYPGAAWHELDVPLERIPLFVKEGTLLPLARPVECVVSDTCFDVTVKCYGEKIRDFVLYEDDGISYRYREGEYNIIRLTRLPDGSFDIIRTNHCGARRYKIVEWMPVR